MTAKTIDAYDVEGLEKSLNDSATRVSALWISFLIFSLYLVISAATVTHRQLLLAEPITLPVLNIGLPLFGFFWLAPILYLVFHTYVMLQIILLNRTAATYNEALDRVIRSPTANASMRQRLANTLFAQMFAGSPRERHGMIGAILTLIAWTTLAIFPVSVLFAFLIAFLPNHSLFVAWSHRIVIASEFFVLMICWPLMFDATKDFRLGSLYSRSSIICLLIFVVSVFVLTFPGEPQRPYDWYTQDSWDSCSRGFLSDIDRLNVTRQQLVDPEKLAKIEAAGVAKGLKSYEGQRTIDLSRRRLECGVFDGADLRRADLRGAILSGANMQQAYLQGAELSEAMLVPINLEGARLDEANLTRAKLVGAALWRASLRGSVLNTADLEGAHLSAANFQGADLTSAQLDGAELIGADLRGAGLAFTRLVAADLGEARLDGASLLWTFGEAANFSGAVFRGALLAGSNLQGASFSDGSKSANLTDAFFFQANVWHAGLANCLEAAVIEPSFEAAFANALFTHIEGTPEAIEEEVKGTLSRLPTVKKNREFETKLRKALDGGSEAEQAASRSSWKKCTSKTIAPKRMRRILRVLVSLACGKDVEAKYLIQGIYRVWFLTAALSPQAKNLSKSLASAILDEKRCPSLTALSEQQRADLRSLL
jgi:uncharacterized protein YjbI with pentapeptide repeats